MASKLVSHHAAFIFNGFNNPYCSMLFKRDLRAMHTRDINLKVAQVSPFRELLSPRSRKKSHRRESGRKKPLFGTDGILTVRRARLAIQQHDDIYDAVVISTLPHYPFCCHEDLVTMSRSQLLRVVDSFNSRLPLNAQIVISESSSASYIRNCIENIVGITPPVPRDPESINQQSSRRKFRAFSFNDFRLHGMSLSPGSLLATQDSRGQELVSKSRRTLETLVEDDEDGAPKNQRTIKKERLLNDAEETSLGHGERRLPFHDEASFVKSSKAGRLVN